MLLVRDSDRGLEVFMEKRHIKSDFVGGAYVFPGGRVDPEDRIDATLCCGLDDAVASKRLGLDHGGLAFWVAAIRECFEEAGVLLAYDASGQLLALDPPAVAARFGDLRRKIYDQEMRLTEMAEAEGLSLATDRIHYWSHWITPEGQPRRYDTRFFIAEAPANQTAAHDDWELVQSAWVTPEEALDRAARREWMIIFPTIKNLEQLARHETSQEAVAWAEAQRDFPVMQPRIFKVGDAIRVVLPGDPGYDEAEADTTGVGQDVWSRAASRKD